MARLHDPDLSDPAFLARQQAALDTLRADRLREQTPAQRSAGEEYLRRRAAPSSLPVPHASVGVGAFVARVFHHPAR